MVRSFSVTTRTAAPVEQIFDASLSIDHHLESMRTSGERAVDGVTSGQIGLGESVTWRARHFGIRFTMSSRVTELERPRRFVDEQVRGPFRVFRHEHVFRAERPGTVMVDTITLASPDFGIPVIAVIAERMILVPYLRRLIRQRNAHLVSAVAPIPPAYTRPELGAWPVVHNPRFRRAEASAVVGRGSVSWARVSHDVLSWRVKTRSGFRVDSSGPVRVGDRPIIRARVLGATVTEPVEVIAVVNEPTRVGFAYRTLPGHPVLGEEAFIVHRENTGDWSEIRFTVRSLTAPAPQPPWRWVYPVLRVAQRVVRRRYLRALR